MKKKMLSTVLAVALVMGMMTGCGSSKKDSAENKETAIVLSSTKSENFDPYAGISTDTMVTKAIFSSLVNYGPEGEIIPDVAESWKESEDGMEITFKLREDIKFQNGDALTADDVVYTFDTIYASETMSWLSDDIAYCKKVDDYTVTLGKTTPVSRIYENCIEFVYILPRDCRESDVAGFDAAPIGCGPYKLVSKEADDTVKLETFEEYFGDAPGFKYVDVKPAIDPANAVIGLQTKEIDLIPNIPATQAQLLEDESDLTHVSRSDGYGMNNLLLMGDVFRDDPNLRKAVFHAVNRENAIILGNEGVGEIPKDMFSTRVMGEYAGAVDMTLYDLELAKDYLAKSKYNGQTITITICENAPLAEAVLTDLGQIGIKAQIEQLDMNDYYAKMYDGNTEITMTTMGSDVLSVPAMLYMFTQEYIWYGGIMTNNPQLDEIVLKVYRNKLEEGDDIDKLNIEAYKIFYDMAEWVPLYEKTGNYSYGPNVVYEYPISAITEVYYLAKIMPAN